MRFNEFSVSVYGNLQPYSDVASKARVRIFYKYGNRNGTYITDEFADKLVSTLPYTVVSGIYDGQDFTDHGQNRSDSKIYGIVPENPNVSWEFHLDEDGVEREYACADVLLFTARYPEAREIVGKGQSMELYTGTLKYHKEIREGQLYCVFDEGCFLGLQALGDAHTPCFQGAAFFELQNTIDQVIDQLRNYSLEENEMPKVNFKLSDDQKFEAIWTLLNSEFTEEGEWTMSYSISAIYDEYALAFNIQSGKFERVYYTKNDAEDSLVLGDHQEVYIMDITSDEKNTLDTLRKLNGDTYEAVSETLEKAEEVSAQYTELSEIKTNLESKIEEYTTTISTLNTEMENAKTEYETKCAEYDTKVEELSAECQSLTEYKESIEKSQKEAVIAEYEGQLSDEVLDTYKEKLDEYTVTELDKELAYELKKANPTVFTVSSQNNGYVPKEVPLKGIEHILSRYKN